MHAAVDTLGHLLTLYATPADAQDWGPGGRARPARPAGEGDRVEVAFVDQGFTSDGPAADGAAHGIRLELEDALPRFVRGYERRLTVLAGLHFVAFGSLEL